MQLIFCSRIAVGGLCACFAIQNSTALRCTWSTRSSSGPTTHGPWALCGRRVGRWRRRAACCLLADTGLQAAPAVHACTPAHAGLVAGPERKTLRPRDLACTLLPGQQWEPWVCSTPCAQQQVACSVLGPAASAVGVVLLTQLAGVAAMSQLRACPQCGQQD